MSLTSRRRTSDSLNKTMDESLKSYSKVANAADVSSIATFVGGSLKEKLPEAPGRFTKPISLTALAAGLGATFIAVPMEGKVVVTKANIPVNSTASLLPPTSLDINHDGVVDLVLGRNGFASGGTFDLGIGGSAPHGGVIVTANGYAAALRHGATIGPSGKFANQFDVESLNGTIDGKSISHGNWGHNPINRFMGVKFLINGQTHYGWVRLQITIANSDIEGTITGYAYETVANKKLEAGVQSEDLADSAAIKSASPTSRCSLGMLALGADGLAIWRRDL